MERERGLENRLDIFTYTENNVMKIEVFPRKVRNMIYPKKMTKYFMGKWRKVFGNSGRNEPRYFRIHNRYVTYRVRLERIDKIIDIELCICWRIYCVCLYERANLFRLLRRRLPQPQWTSMTLQTQRYGRPTQRKLSPVDRPCYLQVYRAIDLTSASITDLWNLF